jgi:hypothetical protein
MDELIVTTLGGHQRILCQAAMVKDKVKDKMILYQAGHNLYWIVRPKNPADRVICEALDFYNYGRKIDGRVDIKWVNSAAPTDYFIYTPDPPLA